MFIKEIHSDYYGKLQCRLAGIIDFKTMKDKMNIAEWFMKNHPREHFNFFSIEQIEDSKYTISGFESFVVYVPLVEDNKDWKPEPGNGYYKHWNSSKRVQKLGLVIATKRDDLEKWQQTAPEVLTPDYYFTANNFKELKTHFNKVHDYV